MGLGNLCATNGKCELTHRWPTETFVDGFELWRVKHV